MKNAGFISQLLLVVVALAALKYFFNWSIFDALNSEQGSNTLAYMKEVVLTSWLYIKIPFAFAWQKTLALVPSALNFFHASN